MSRGELERKNSESKRRRNGSVESYITSGIIVCLLAALPMMVGIGGLWRKTASVKKEHPERDFQEEEWTDSR